MIELTAALLAELGLSQASVRLEAGIEAAMATEESYLEFLSGLLSHETDARRQRSYDTRLKMAALPHHKGLGDFDFAFAKGVDKNKKTVTELSHLGFVSAATNICSLGPPGVGKTHLAVALCLEAIAGGHSVYFTTMAEMAADLAGVPTPAKVRKYLGPKVLVIDEIGYRPLDGRAGSTFFEVVSERYQTASIICSSNKSFTEWGSLFGDAVLATTILDRLLHWTAPEGKIHAGDRGALLHLGGRGAPGAEHLTWDLLDADLGHGSLALVVKDSRALQPDDGVADVGRIDKDGGRKGLLFLHSLRSYRFPRRLPKQTLLGR